MFGRRLTARGSDWGSPPRSLSSAPLTVLLAAAVGLLAAAVRLAGALPVEHYSALQDATAATTDEDLSLRLAAFERLCAEPSDEETQANFCVKMAAMLRGGYAPRRQSAWASDDDYHYFYNYAPVSESDERVFKRYQPLYPKRASFLRFGRASGGGRGDGGRSTFRRFGYGDD